MCKAKLHLKSPCLHRGGRRKRMAHLANCHHLSSREVKLLHWKDLLGMQPVCAVESLPCSGGPMIKSSKTKCYLNKAQRTPPRSLAHKSPLQRGGRHVASPGDMCGSMFQNFHGEPRDQGEVQVEAHSFKAPPPSPGTNTEWGATWQSSLLDGSSMSERFHFSRSATPDHSMGIAELSNSVLWFQKSQPLCVVNVFAS